MDREIRKYISAVGRRLNLPRENRRRLLSDLETTIAARMEQRESWQEIRQSFGPPSQAAAAYMAQMQGVAYRKSPWRFVFLVGGVLLGLRTAWEGILWAMMMVSISAPASSVGIIRGADGPTAIFVTRPRIWHFSFGWGLVLTLVFLLVFWRLRRCKQK